MCTDEYSRSVVNNPKSNLVANKILGFALAYCDNDGNPSRDSFIGSEVINASDKNVAYKDASVFGALQLKGGVTSGVSDNTDYGNSTNFYPNPATDKIYFGLGVQARILNHAGIEVISESSNSYINISSLSAGIYMVELTKNGNVSRKKLIKE